MGPVRCRGASRPCGPPRLAPVRRCGSPLWRSHASPRVCRREGVGGSRREDRLLAGGRRDVLGEQLSPPFLNLPPGRVARHDDSHRQQSAIKHLTHEQTLRCGTFQSRVEPSTQCMTEAAQGIFAAINLPLPAAAPACAGQSLSPSSWWGDDAACGAARSVSTLGWWQLWHRRGAASVASRQRASVSGGSGWGK